MSKSSSKSALIVVDVVKDYDLEDAGKLRASVDGEIEKLILIGQVAEQCILYSALDAYIRHFDVHVPPDAVAHIREDLTDAALKMMQVSMGADLTPAGELL